VGFLVFICILVLVALVVAVLSAPLRAARERREGDKPARVELAEQASRDDLQTAREAKYREIRDAELDFRTGKLSPEDYETVDAELRAEALTILDALERLPEG
jgi:hypothetical protein